MYNKDFDSLNAGAYANLPQQDIRLSGNHRLTNTLQDSGIMAAGPRGTYTQNRKNQMMMAGGGVANLKNIQGQDHMLAYITPGEANTLKNLGGQETMTPEGIPAYPPPGEYGGPGSGAEGRGAPGMSPGRSTAQFGHPGHAGKTESQAKTDQASGKNTPDNKPSGVGVTPTGTLPSEKDTIPETIKKKIISPTHKFLYGVTGNNPKFEKKHINYLLKQGVNVPSNILGILNIDDDENIPFDLYQEYLEYKPTLPNQVSPGDPSGEYNPNRGMSLPMDAANYALVEGKKPGLIMGGDLGSFYKMENPKGAINPDTGKPFTNAEWDTFKRGVMEDRGLTDGGNDGQGITSQYPYPYPINTAVSPAVAGTGTTNTVAAATGNPFVPGSGLPFANYYVGANPTAAQLAYGQQMGVDPGIYGKTTYADGGRIGYAGGGIADLRQGYFLGKLVKKIGRGVK